MVLSGGQAGRGVVESVQAANDVQLIDLWLHGRGANTQRAYRRAAEELLSFVDCDLRSVTLGALQGWADCAHMQKLGGGESG